MQYKFQVTGPFILQKVDPTDPKYLLLTFSDGHTRKMAKGGNWPQEYAEALLNKSISLEKKSVYIKTSQTTKAWETTKWMCDLIPEDIAVKSNSIVAELNPEESPSVVEDKQKYILIATSAGITYYAYTEYVADYFSSEDDYLDFCQSFEKDFVASWRAKNARTKGFPPGVKRVRITGLGNRTKRNGFRIVAAEVETDESNQTFKFFHLLKIDEKTENEDYPSDNEIKEIIKARNDLEKKYPKAYVNWIQED